MADLDDFFAKKDRKKSKTKKFTTAEELAKKTEEPAKKPVEIKARITANTNNPETVEVKANEQPEEEEWKEFEEERKDYSGLKLAQLNLNEEQQMQTNQGFDDGSKDSGEQGYTEGGENADRQSGAWKKVESSASETAAVAAEKEPTARGAASVYVSPAMKNLRMKPKKGVAPDIKSEEFFPTLGAEQPDTTKVKKDTTFEEVKHGGRIRPSDMPASAPLSVGNRFTSLSNDAS